LACKILFRGIVPELGVAERETLTVGGISVNVAVTDLAAVIETVQVPVRFVHAPDQPEKVYPVTAVAVKVTEVLCA
jgi:hypothetical protein